MEVKDVVKKLGIDMSILPRPIIIKIREQNPGYVMQGKFVKIIPLKYSDAFIFEYLGFYYQLPIYPDLEEVRNLQPGAHLRIQYHGKYRFTPTFSNLFQS